MLLRHLKYFATIAEEGSVLRAAVRLRVAQPALSRQMHDLESEVGSPVFERGRRGVSLTTAGSTLLHGVQHALVRLEVAVKYARLAHVGMFGTVRVGLSRGAVAAARVGAAVQEVQNQLPEVDLVLSEVSIYGHANALRSGDLDLAIGFGNEEDPGIRRDVLYPEYVDSALLSTEHPLAQRDILEVEDVRRERAWAIRSSLTHMPEVFRELKGLGVEWDEVDSIETAYAQVATGRGWLATVRAMQGSTPRGTTVIPIRGLRIPLPMSLRARASDETQLVANVRSVLLHAAEHTSVKLWGAARQPKVVAPVVAAVAQDGAPGGSAEVPQGLELRQLRALITTLEEGSPAEAARRLGLTQSGLTRQLRALERELGCSLLQRGVTGVEPTPAGEVFRTEAAAVLSLVERAIAGARRAARGIAGACTIGSIPAELTSGLLLATLKMVSERFPDVAIEVREMESAAEPWALRDRQIDLGLAGAVTRSLEEPGISSVILVDDPIECVLLPASHRLANRAWIRPADLAGEPFVFPPRSVNPAQHDIVVQALLDLGLAPNIGGSLNGPRILWNTIASSKGWGLATRSQRTNPPPGLVAVPLEGLSIPWGLRLMWRSDETDNAVKRVLDVFRDNRHAQSG